MAFSAIPITNNVLLAALPKQERDHVLEHCEHITLAQDQVLCERGAAMSHVYFPIDASVSVLVDVDLNDVLGVSVVGGEDMLGASLILGLSVSPFLLQVHRAGTALRMSADTFKDALPLLPVLDRRLRLLLHIQLAQLAQTAGCAAFHVVEQRLAYLLLLTHDRANGQGFYMTHDHLAHLLGVRRSGVSTAAGVLHQKKLIAYSRGRISILDRPGLKRASCSCYSMICDTVTQVDHWNMALDETESHAAIAQEPRDSMKSPRRARSSPPLHAG